MLAACGNSDGPVDVQRPPDAVVDVERARRAARQAQHGNRIKESFPHFASSLRCVCTDIRIPKAAMMVTMDVPP